MTGIRFNGNFIIKPGAYATIDGEGMMSLTTAEQKIVAFVGESDGGTPHEIMWFDDPSVAKRVLKGGDLLKACEKAWSPVRKNGRTGEGAHVIGVIRVNNATKSTLEMGDGIMTLARTSAVRARASNNGNVGEDAITVTGIYTGSEDKTIEIYVDSEGTNDYQNTTFRWRFAREIEWKGINIPAGENNGVIALTDGLILTFTGGSYAYNDIFSFDAYTEKNQRIPAIIESKDYGVLTRQTQVKYGDGSIETTKKLTVYNWGDNRYETFDNIGATIFLSYKGSMRYVVAEVKHGTSVSTSGKAERLIIWAGEDEASAEEYITIDLTDDRFRRIKSIVDYISSFEEFECSSYDKMINDILSSDLDEMKIDIRNQSGTLLAYWADLTKRVSDQSMYITITRQDTSAKEPMDFDFISLADGDNGIVPSSWVDYFDKFAAHPITYLVPLTGDESIHAEAREHVINMSNSAGRERFLIIGGWVGESHTRAANRAKSHNSDRVQLVMPGFYDRDGNNSELALYPPYLTAAMHAGRVAFLPNGESATYNYYNVDALEYELQPDQINSLLRNGVTCLEFVMGKGQRLVQDITTYSNEDSVSLRTERSVRILADTFNKQLRELLEELYIGVGGSRSVVTSCQNAVISFLKEKLRIEEILSYKNVSVKKDGKALYVEYEVAPVEPNNFVLITGHFYSEQIHG